MFWKVFYVLYTLHMVCTVGAKSYKPIVCMHGFDGYETDFDDIKSFIAEAHPGTVVVSLDINNGPASIKPMWQQVNETTALLASIVLNNDTFANGYHLMGHSQGGILTRAIIETWDDHNVLNYISLAGVQLGVCNLGAFSEYFNLTNEEFNEIVYKPEVQNHISCAGYWRDCSNYQLYTEKNLFLAYINGETTSANPSLKRYKSNFLRIQNAAYFSSPQDGTIFPWQEEIMGYYDDSMTNIVNMTSQPVYINDGYGLKTLHTNKRLFLHTVEGVKHSAWLHNQTNFINNVLPYLY